MLAVKRRVIGKLVDQEAGAETHVGPAAFDDADRRARADDGVRRPELDYRPPVFEDDITAGTLGETIAVLVADHFEVFRRESRRFRGDELDDFNRHTRFVKERYGFIARVGRLCRRPPRMGRNGAFSRWRWQGRLLRAHRLTETHLAVSAIDDPSFAFLAEDLPFEPGQLLLENLDFLAQQALRTHQVNDLLRTECGRNIKAGQLG